MRFRGTGQAAWVSGSTWSEEGGGEGAWRLGRGKRRAGRGLAALAAAPTAGTRTVGNGTRSRRVRGGHAACKGGCPPAGRPLAAGALPGGGTGSGSCHAANGSGSCHAARCCSQPAANSQLEGSLLGQPAQAAASCGAQAGTTERAAGCCAQVLCSLRSLEMWWWRGGHAVRTRHVAPHGGSSSGRRAHALPARRPAPSVPPAGSPSLPALPAGSPQGNCEAGFDLTASANHACPPTTTLPTPPPAGAP